nr:prepilin-type N-terminal cleavage/methylation domain-containing protein [Priestia abyssalis]
MLKRMLKNEKGLTLIELLAVIVILGIIAAIAVPSIGGIIQKSKEDAVKADALQILNAAKVYVASNGVDDVSIDQTDLASYVNGVDDFVSATYTVTTDKDSKTFKLKTGEITAGKVKIKFDDADVTAIEKKTPAAVEGVITIK